MQIHELKPEHKNKKSKRVGRGVTRGKTSGRGHKGQKARAGANIRPAARDMIKKIPKKRGHGVNRAKTVNVDKPAPAEVKIAELENNFENGEQVTPKSLVAKSVVKKKGGRIPPVKILDGGEVNKELAVSGCGVSSSAKDKIEKVGGEISL